MRAGTAFDALRALGEVDLFVVRLKHAEGTVVPEARAAGPARAAEVPFPKSRVSRMGRLRSGILGPPVDVALRDYGEIRDRLRTFASRRYDVIWVRGAHTYAAMGPALHSMQAPRIVDLDDLQGPWIRGRVAAERANGRPPRFRDVVRLLELRLSARHWPAFERHIAREVDAVVVCSEADREQIGVPNARVVPNTYERPPRAAGTPEMDQWPSMLFQGNFRYGPNRDAARFLCREVFPLIRSQNPVAELRLVGRSSQDVDVLGERPGVTVVGHVRDMTTELARASVLVVPIQYGGGTRIKLLEAFAHRIPAVSTSVGAHGLAVENDVHLLIADRPDDIADSCVRLLSNSSERARLADAAHDLFLERYETSVALDAIHRMVEQLVRP